MKLCSTCFYWAGPEKKGDKVACYRYPPKTEIMEKEGRKVIVTVWPLTSGTDWCGEHKSKSERGQNE